MRRLTLVVRGGGSGYCRRRFGRRGDGSDPARTSAGRRRTIGCRQGCEVSRARPAIVKAAPPRRGSEGKGGAATRDLASSRTTVRSEHEPDVDSRRQSHRSRRPHHRVK